MTIEQTVDIPASRRITIDVPREIPVGRAVIAFRPVDDCPLCAKHRDPKTGELRFNDETIAAIEEGRAMMRGEIPAQRFNSLEELLADLRTGSHSDLF